MGEPTRGAQHVLVIGAGVVGVTTAWYLAERGFEVTVIDRGAQPASETSHANGGQISVSHATPWANPQAPLTILRWLASAQAPLLFRPHADIRQWRWLAQFLLECLPARTARNTAQLVHLGIYSRNCLRALRQATNIQYDGLSRGILHIYEDAREYQAATEAARQIGKFGCALKMIGPEEAVAIEPALAHARAQLIGASWSPDDESGDACRFTRELAARCASRGVQFLQQHQVTALRSSGNRITHVETLDPEGNYGKLQADRYVLAAGPESPLLAASVGLRLNVYPAKGYSATLPVADPARAYTVSITDDAHKLVFSRLGDLLRIAGTAELAGWNRALNPVRCQAIIERFEQLFPGAADTAQARFWSGLRPTTPSNVPLVGGTRWTNLLLNTGHGTLGWTLACGSAAALAELMSGQRPAVDFAFSPLPA